MDQNRKSKENAANLIRDAAKDGSWLEWHCRWLCIEFMAQKPPKALKSGRVNITPFRSILDEFKARIHVLIERAERSCEEQTEVCMGNCRRTMYSDRQSMDSIV